MTPRSVIVAPHPDDEVLGASWMLVHGDSVVVHVTDGAPPWADPDLAEIRRRESVAAWAALGAEIREVVRLGFGDLSVWREVPALADAIVAVVDGQGPTTVHVPAHQGGHPDHDAVFAAALLARRRRPQHRWRTYGLYGLDPRRRLVFGALPGGTRVGSSEEHLVRKAAALRAHASQLRPASVLQRWLDAPADEADAPMPDTLPPSGAPCFYDEELGFSAHGVTQSVVRAALDRALADLSPP